MPKISFATATLAAVFAIPFTAAPCVGSDAALLGDLNSGNVVNVCWAILHIERHLKPGLIDIPEGTHIHPFAGYGIAKSSIPEGEFANIVDKYKEVVESSMATEMERHARIDDAYIRRQRQRLSSRHCDLLGSLESDESDTIHAALSFLDDNGAPGHTSSSLNRETIRMAIPANRDWLLSKRPEEVAPLNARYREYLSSRSLYYSPDAYETFSTAE